LQKTTTAEAKDKREGHVREDVQKSVDEQWIYIYEEYLQVNRDEQRRLWH
jgi:hypothetical protein